MPTLKAKAKAKAIAEVVETPHSAQQPSIAIREAAAEASKK